MNSRKALAFPSLLGTLLSLALFGILMAGCGSSTVGSMPSTIPPTSAAIQKCGSIGVVRNQPVLIAPASIAKTSASSTVTPSVAGTCFWQAFQQCQPASLVVSFGSVDTVTTHTFTLQKQNTNCAISDVVQSRIIPRPAKTIGTYTCTGLVNASNELHFNGCGTLGNVVVPTSSVANPQ